ncbi:unnamed protein product [Symbiodinium sp. CCMP2592]|nr:unnamed protein product [Symbiodinium sp. CCMP2592]
MSAVSFLVALVAVMTIQTFEASSRTTCTSNESDVLDFIQVLVDNGKVTAGDDRSQPWPVGFKTRIRRRRRGFYSHYGYYGPTTTSVRTTTTMVTTTTTTTATTSTAVVCTTCSAHVWINEFHYDNAGSDVDEFVELAGLAGTDLTGWQIVYYNGNGSPYDTDTPGTVVLTPSAGATGLNTCYGFYVQNRNSIQNGAPDGIALVDSTGQVTEFISYEGTITANSGPAAGMTSVDVGVSESSTTPVGDSLQLAGQGLCGPGFDWAGPVPDTPGAINVGQSFE